MPKKRALSESTSEDSDSSTSSAEKVKKKVKKTAEPKKKDTKSSSKDCEWSLSDKRKIKISEFKNKHYVMIRDFYENSDGKMMPGKQGINLTFDQWDLLKSFIPEIDEAIAKI